MFLEQISKTNLKKSYLKELYETLFHCVGIKYASVVRQVCIVKTINYYLIICKREKIKYYYIKRY